MSDKDPIDARLAAEAAAKAAEAQQAEEAERWLRLMRRAFRGIMDEPTRKRFLAAAAERLNV